MANVFISYTHSDRTWVNRLSYALEALGYAVWFDKDLLPGDPFLDVISEQLKKADCVIVIWSKESVGRHWVKAEAEFALERGVYIPIRLGSPELIIPFRTIQTPDMTGWKGDTHDSLFIPLLNAIDKRLISSPNNINPKNSSSVTPIKKRLTLKKRIYFFLMLSLPMLFLSFTSYTSNELVDFQQIQLGLNSSNIGESKKSLLQLQRLASEGNPEAYYILGGLYFDGKLVVENILIGCKYYRLAVMAGHTKAKEFYEAEAKKFCEKQRYL